MESYNYDRYYSLYCIWPICGLILIAVSMNHMKNYNLLKINNHKNGTLIPYTVILFHRMYATHISRCRVTSHVHLFCGNCTPKLMLNYANIFEEKKIKKLLINKTINY